MLPRVTSPAAGAPEELVRKQPPVEAPPVRTGSGFVMIFAVLIIIVLIGRVFDYVLTGYRLPAIICALSLMAAIAGGGIQYLRSRVGVPQLALIAWMCAATLFSTWRGGSADYVLTYAFVTMTWLTFAAGPRHLGDVRKLIYLVLILYVGLLVFGADQEGVEQTSRLEAVSGTHGNSEDVALIAGFVLPLCIYVASRFSFGPVRWVLISASVLFVVRTVALTGSRAGMLALAVLAAVSLYRMNGAKRLLVVLAVGAGLVFVIVTVPGHLKERLATIFDSFQELPDEQTPSSEAIESTRERRKVLMDSVWATVKHPIFGVGPGQFAEYRWSTAKQVGVFKPALVTHNSYTQVSSESGIPGLLLYIAMLYGIFKTLQKARARNRGTDPESQEFQSLIFNLELSFVVFLVCALFMSIEQYTIQFLIGGLALAIERISNLRPLPPEPAARPSPLVAGGPRKETAPGGRYSRPGLELPSGFRDGRSR